MDKSDVGFYSSGDDATWDATASKKRKPSETTGTRAGHKYTSASHKASEERVVPQSLVDTEHKSPRSKKERQITVKTGSARRAAPTLPSKREREEEFAETVEVYHDSFLASLEQTSAKKAKVEDDDEGLSIKEKVHVALQTVKSVKDSICGKLALVTLRGMITENVAEATGQVLGDQIGPTFSGAVVEAASHVPTPIAAPVVSTLLGGVIGVAKSLSSGKVDYQDMAKKGLIAAGVGGCVVFGAPVIAATVAGLNMPIAASVVEIATNILGGYIASRLHGTDERLVKFDEPLDSYFLKSLQAMGAAQVFTMVAPAPIQLGAKALKFGAGIVAEAIGFNALLIAKVAQKTLQGQLLSGVLLGDEQIAELINTYLSSSVKTELSDPSRTTVWLRMVHDALPILLATPGEALGGAHDVTESVRGFLKQNSKTVSGLNFVKIERVMLRLLQKGTQFAIASFKSYFKHLAEDPLVVAAKENFDAIYDQFANEKDPHKAEECKVLLEEAFIHLRLAVNMCIGNVIDNEKALCTNKTVKPLLSKISEMSGLNKVAYEQLCARSRDIAGIVGQQVNTLAKEHVGVSVMQSENTEYLALLLNIHLDNISKVFLMNALTSMFEPGSLPKLTKEDVKEFYADVTSVVSSLFRCTIGKRSSTLLVETLKKQIVNSEL